jgi:hypothetical protein
VRDGMWRGMKVCGARSEVGREAGQNCCDLEGYASLGVEEPVVSYESGRSVRQTLREWDSASCGEEGVRFLGAWRALRSMRTRNN